MLRHSCIGLTMLASRIAAGLSCGLMSTSPERLFLRPDAVPGIAKTAVHPLREPI
jgi:hypothetical protein